MLNSPRSSLKSDALSCSWIKQMCPGGVECKPGVLVRLHQGVRQSSRHERKRTHARVDVCLRAEPFHELNSSLNDRPFRKRTLPWRWWCALGNLFGAESQNDLMSFASLELAEDFFVQM